MFGSVCQCGEGEEKSDERERETLRSMGVWGGEGKSDEREREIEG